MAPLVKTPVMASHVGVTPDLPTSNVTRLREWMHRVIGLLDVAVEQLQHQEHPAERVLLEAATLLRQQIDPQAAAQTYDARGRLLAWQARRVKDYIDAHIAGPLLVGELCALIQRSEAHFSRSFKRTFGESPHAFLIRRRLDLAAQYMLDTDASLSDISVRCGFTDQAHLSKHFRQVTGQTPAFWRRVRRTQMPSPRRAALAQPYHSASGPALCRGGRGRIDGGVSHP
jgi:AraC family transcriptional regulator